MSVRYSLSFPEPHSHLFRVRLAVSGHDGPLRVAMPVWTPGSYLVREFSRHVQDVSAADGAGRPLPSRRLDKRTWQVEPRGGDAVLTWRVYANEPSVRTNHLDGSHAFVAPAATFMEVEGWAGPYEVTVEPPPGWQVFTPLPEEGGAFVAADFDTLVDSPFEVGPHRSLAFEAAGRPHRLVLAGEGNWDEEAFVRDVRPIVEQAAAIFGGRLPYERYLFVLLSMQGIRGGLEHKDASILAWGALDFAPRKRWEDFLRLVAHEHFHAWNIKRIRPKVLGPFDYAAEAYTRTLWLHEGGTVYYDGLVPVRAGVVRVKTWLSELGDSIKALESQPGRLHMSVAESSQVAWVKLYRRDEHSRNSTISYYLKGDLVCLLLDQAIRERSGGAKSLDDVMRHLFALTAPPQPGYDEERLPELLREATGVDVSELLARWVDGVEELPLDEALAWYGLKVERSVKGGNGDVPAAEMGWLGADVATKEGRLVVTGVAEGTPAWRDGVYCDDEILALDGWRVDAGSLPKRLEVRRPGERVVVTVARHERLVDVPVTLGARPFDEVKVTARPDATDEQRARFLAWSGQPLPVEA